MEPRREHSVDALDGLCLGVRADLHQLVKVYKFICHVKPYPASVNRNLSLPEFLFVSIYPDRLTARKAVVRSPRIGRQLASVWCDCGKVARMGHRCLVLAG